MLAISARAQYVADPARVQKAVAYQMNHLPKGLHLSRKQRLGLRLLYLKAAGQEQDVIALTAGRTRQRVQIGAIENHLRSGAKKLLSPEQFKILAPKLP